MFMSTCAGTFCLIGNWGDVLLIVEGLSFLQLCKHLFASRVLRAWIAFPRLYSFYHGGRAG